MEKPVEMASGSGEKIVVPRNFVLLEELEKAEKGNTDMTVSYGLVNGDDTFLSDWQCTILGPPNSPVENRIISLTLHAGENYPDEMPEVQFQTKVNFPFVVRAASAVPRCCDDASYAPGYAHRATAEVVAVGLC